MRIAVRRLLPGLLILAASPATVPAATYAYDAAGRLARADYDEFAVAYRYDANGNLIGRDILSVQPPDAELVFASGFEN